MNGSKMTTQRKAILAAVKKAPPGGDYVWDGTDENDRRLSCEEMQKGVEAYRKKRGRPISAARKEQVYMSLPEHAIMLYRDEKSWVHALNRTQHGLLLKQGRTSKMLK